MDFKTLNQQRQACAETLLGLYHRAHAGHIGASLSCLEILVDLCFGRMRPEDKLLLSKGHAAAALYTVLAKSGRLDEAELETYYQDHTRLAAHPPCSGEIPAIPFGTGSLGHGLSLSAGLAFSQKFTGKSFEVFCVVSDGDCNEGSTWEAAMFAAHQKLKNLTVIMDANCVQGFGTTREVCNLDPLEDKWRAFGFETQVAGNGNAFEDLAAAFGRFSPQPAGPRCLIARTVKGHGVSYMENKMEWHYLPMNDEQYQQALQETRSRHA
jgi:transketolase